MQRIVKRHSPVLPGGQQGDTQALLENLQWARHCATCFMEAREVDMGITPISQTRILRLREVK